jgi:uncharacterized membrane-anchored protein YhcB (DUF1043 family)
MTEHYLNENEQLMSQVTLHAEEQNQMVSRFNEVQESLSEMKLKYSQLYEKSEQTIKDLRIQLAAKET